MYKLTLYNIRKELINAKYTSLLIKHNDIEEQNHRFREAQSSISIEAKD